MSESSMSLEVTHTSIWRCIFLEEDANVALHRGVSADVDADVDTDEHAKLALRLDIDKGLWENSHTFSMYGSALRRSWMAENWM